MPRCHNKVADGLADLTMDVARSWEKKFETRLAPAGSNLVVQTDGGLRQHGCAAAAWIVGLWGVIDGNYVYEPLIAHGTFVSTSVSVFGCEAIALAEAGAAMDSLIGDVV